MMDFSWGFLLAITDLIVDKWDWVVGVSPARMINLSVLSSAGEVTN